MRGSLAGNTGLPPPGQGWGMPLSARCSSFYPADNELKAHSHLPAWFHLQQLTYSTSRSHASHVMLCYYKNPEATDEVLKDGWLYTGDMARMDEDGFIYLVDRKKDVIISGGENLSLCFHKTAVAVPFSQKRFLNFSRRIPGHLFKDDLLRPLLADCVCLRNQLLLGSRFCRLRRAVWMEIGDCSYLGRSGKCLPGFSSGLFNTAAITAMIPKIIMIP